MNTATVATALFVKNAAYVLVMETVKTKVAGKRLLRRRVMIETRRGVLDSRPVYIGTRIKIKTIASWIYEGASDDEILRSYPSLELKQIKLTRKLMKELSGVLK